MKYKTSKSIKDNLIAINFKKSYFGFGEITEEEDLFLKQDFKVVVTENTKNNGYKIDSENVKEYLQLNHPYILDEMQVSQSSSSLSLKEFPNRWFNTSNFEFIDGNIKFENAFNDDKVYENT